MSDYTPPPAQTPVPTPAGQPQYGYQPTYAPPTNALAIVALILALVAPPGGIIAGHIALGQIKRTGESGHGLALAGVIIGYAYTALVLLIIVFSFAVPLVILGIVGSAGGFS